MLDQKNLRIFIIVDFTKKFPPMVSVNVAWVRKLVIADTASWPRSLTKIPMATT